MASGTSRRLKVSGMRASTSMRKLATTTDGLSADSTTGLQTQTSDLQTTSYAETQRTTSTMRSKSKPYTSWHITTLTLETESYWIKRLKRTEKRTSTIQRRRALYTSGASCTCGWEKTMMRIVMRMRVFGSTGPRDREIHGRLRNLRRRILTVSSSSGLDRHCET
jgi:hypothetical protein